MSQVRPTRSEQKKLRTIYRKCRDKENDVLKQTVPSAVLVEDESLRAYQRKRRLQYLETPPAKRAPSSKSHSPDFATVTWNKDAVLRDLQEHPEAPPPINWQKFARDHGIPGSNCGQVLKEFAQKSNIDTARLDGRTAHTRSRMRKRRLHGVEISAPTTPTVSAVKDNWQEMARNGELSLGVPCAPFSLTHYVINNGQLEQKVVAVTGRKFPLTDLKKRLLASHEKYMRLSTDEQINTMPADELKAMMTQMHEDSSDTDEELRERLQMLQRTRTLAIWHDHATLLGLGVVMITVHVVFDAAVFYTQSEWDRNGGEKIDVQATIERPSLYMICAGSSTHEDQAALLQDRIDCLHSLTDEITTSNGFKITDKLRFFVGDHPAQQFERGTQQGGTFKCGGCGVRADMMDDLAHSLQQPWRSLHKLQQIATSGKFGKQAGELKPFDKLKVKQLREELHARGFFNTDRHKNELKGALKEMLTGVQHVPTLMLLNPTGALSDLNLEEYTVLDCEPLHDLKGHLIHLCKELPHLLTGETRKSCEDIISITVSDKMTCADHRIVLLQLYLYLQKQDISKNIKDLLETAIRMSEILYLSDAHRTQRRVLQLYNCSWFHHELCRELFTKVHAGMTQGKMFGSYLHALVAHAPLQYEVISLRSVKTENQERIFSQARKTATATSNRHPQNIVSSLVIRLQAKTEIKGVSAIVKSSESRVAKASKGIHPYKGTAITRSFLRQRLKSWQQHLKRISPFLASGEDVWWESIDGGYLFRDSDNDVENHSEGPNLLHFRHASITDVTKRQTDSWKMVVTQRIQLPTPKIFLYTSEGSPNGEIEYPLHTRGDGHVGNEGISDGHMTTPRDKERGTHELEEESDMESTEDHLENRQTSHAEREVSNDRSGTMNDGENKQRQDDSGQSCNGESGEIHVHVNADNCESEENEEKSGHTINKGSQQVDSRQADSDGCEALCTVEIEESENDNITGVNEDPETPLKDIEINMDPRDD